jgi:hypothetical protein
MEYEVIKKKMQEALEKSKQIIADKTKFANLWHLIKKDEKSK